MQVLKEEVKSSIVTSAINEFKQYGYINSSVRRIAKNAGVTAGNLYRYFKNKEELFNHIIDPVYHTFLHYIEHHNDHDDMLNFGSFQELTKRIEIEGKELADFFVDNCDVFLIMIEGSKGTKYEKTPEELMQHQTSHVIDHLKMKYQGAVPEIAVQTSYALAASYLAGVLQILKLETPANQKKKIFIDYLKIQITGTLSFLT